MDYRVAADVLEDALEVGSMTPDEPSRGLGDAFAQAVAERGG